MTAEVHLADRGHTTTLPSTLLMDQGPSGASKTNPLQPDDRVELVANKVNHSRDERKSSEDG